MVRNPIAWVAILVALAGTLAVFTGLRQRLELRTFVGSCMIIAGLLTAGAAAIFPVILLSTLGTENSLTAYNSSAGRMSLKVAMIWWPVALALSLTYYWFVLLHFSGKEKGCPGHAGSLRSAAAKRLCGTHQQPIARDFQWPPPPPSPRESLAKAKHGWVVAMMLLRLRPHEFPAFVPPGCVSSCILFINGRRHKCRVLRRE